MRRRIGNGRDGRRNGRSSSGAGRQPNRNDARVRIGMGRATSRRDAGLPARQRADARRPGKSPAVPAAGLFRGNGLSRRRIHDKRNRRLRPASGLSGRDGAIRRADPLGRRRRAGRLRGRASRFPPTASPSTTRPRAGSWPGNFNYRWQHFGQRTRNLYIRAGQGGRRRHCAGRRAGRFPDRRRNFRAGVGGGVSARVLHARRHAGLAEFPARGAERRGLRVEGLSGVHRAVRRARPTYGGAAGRGPAPDRSGVVVRAVAAAGAAPVRGRKGRLVSGHRIHPR